MSIHNPLNPLDPLENPNDIDLKPFSNKKIIFNTMWERDVNGVRKLELDAFRSLNSNVNAIGTWYSPVDGTTTKTSVTLFLVRKRMVKLLDIWNRILNSGLFLEARLATAQVNTYYKVVGSNLRNPVAEYLIKANNVSGTLHYPLTLDTVSIFNRIQRFLTAYVNNYNWFVANNASKPSLFPLTTVNATLDFASAVNTYHNPTKPSMMALIEELVTLYKSLISEQRIVAKQDLGFTLADITFLTSAGRENILKLDAYKSDYYSIAPLGGSDFNYLNEPTKNQIVKWLENGSNLDKLCPQFGTEIYRNEENEPWNYKNVIVDLAPFKNSESFTAENLGLGEDSLEFQKLQAKKYWTGSQLDQRKPLYFKTQFINWDNPDDRPYVMLYNGSTLVYIPDEVKEAIHPETILPQQTNVGTYTITGGYVAAAPLPVNMYAMEFTFSTDNTTLENYNRRIFGLYSSRDNWANVLGTSGISDSNCIYLQFDNANIAQAILFENGYKNRTAKLRLENPEEGGSKLYMDDVLIATGSVPYNFSEQWGFSSTNSNRYAYGASITDLKYFYNYGNAQEEAPDNQLNLAANFWKIGTSNQFDPLYDPKANIKLRLDNQGNQPLNEIDKLDFFDNLTLYLKLNQ